MLDLTDYPAITKFLAFARRNPDEAEVFCSGALDIVGNVPIEGTTRSERRIVQALRAAQGRLVSKETLFNAVYLESLDADTPDLKIIDVFVCKLRKKIADGRVDAGGEILTVWGQGYRLVSHEEAKRTLQVMDAQGRDRPARAKRSTGRKRPVGRPPKDTSRRKTPQSGDVASP